MNNLTLPQGNPNNTHHPPENTLPSSFRTTRSTPLDPLDDLLDLFVYFPISQLQLFAQSSSNYSTDIPPIDHYKKLRTSWHWVLSMILIIRILFDIVAFSLVRAYYPNSLVQPYIICINIVPYCAIFSILITQPGKNLEFFLKGSQMSSIISIIYILVLLLETKPDHPKYIIDHCCKFGIQSDDCSTILSHFTFVSAVFIGIINTGSMFYIRLELFLLTHQRSMKLLRFFI